MLEIRIYLSEIGDYDQGSLNYPYLPYSTDISIADVRFEISIPNYPLAKFGRIFFHLSSTSGVVKVRQCRGVLLGAIGHKRYAKVVDETCREVVDEFCHTICISSFGSANSKVFLCTSRSGQNRKKLFGRRSNFCMCFVRRSDLRILQHFFFSKLTFR